MDFLLEALLEVILQLFFEIVIAFLDFALEFLFGSKIADKVRIGASTVFYGILALFCGWLSCKLLPTAIGGHTPQPWVYFFALPLIVAGGLFYLLRKVQQTKSQDSSLVFAWYCVVLSWIFSITRYFFL